MKSTFFANGKLLNPQEAAKLRRTERLEYFQDIKLAHPLLTAAIAKVRQIAVPGSPTNIILVIGPTGVGKTTLGRFIVERLIDDAQDELSSNPDLLPAVMWESPLASERFSFGDWYLSAACEMKSPLASKAIETAVNGDIAHVHSSAAPLVSGLRRAMIGAAKGRRVQLGLVDEAAHILVGSKGESRTARVNALKSLSNSTQMKLGLLGSYDLCALLGITGQTDRRIEVVHFGRYRKGIELVVEVLGGRKQKVTQHAIFNTFAKKVASYLPLHEPFDVSPYLEDLMDASLGIPGIYKDTMHRALTKALDDGGKRMTGTHVERSILTRKQRATILEETLKGEALMSDVLYDDVSFSDLCREDPNPKVAA